MRIVAQPEGSQIGERLMVARLDELGQAEIAAGLIVEHPSRLTHHFIG